MEAAALARRLDLEPEATGICLACLSFVSIPLGAGNERRARSEARRIARDLRDEGLQAPLRAALERARDAGDPDAAVAFAEVEVFGSEARIVVHAIERLARMQCERTRAALRRNESPWAALGFEPGRSDVYVRKSDV